MFVYIASFPWREFKVSCVYCLFSMRQLFCTKKWLRRLCHNFFPRSYKHQIDNRIFNKKPQRYPVQFIKYLGGRGEVHVLFFNFCHAICSLVGKWNAQVLNGHTSWLVVGIVACVFVGWDVLEQHVSSLLLFFYHLVLFSQFELFWRSATCNC